MDDGGGGFDEVLPDIPGEFMPAVGNLAQFWTEEENERAAIMTYDGQLGPPDLVEQLVEQYEPFDQMFEVPL